MIITCNKCSTSFNLDDSLVKEDGSKVRCTVCKHIFTAYPLPGELEQEPEEFSSLDLESDPDDGDSMEEPSDFEMEDNDFSFEEDSDISDESSDLEIEEPGLEMEDSDLEVDDDFSFKEDEFEIDEDSESQNLELEESHLDFEDAEEEDLDEIEFETIEDDEPASFGIEDSEPDLETQDEIDLKATDSQASDESFEDDSVADEDEFELEFDINDDSENKTSDILDDEINELPLEIETEPNKEGDDVLSPEESKTEENEPPIITPEDDFSEYDEVLEQETEPEDDSLEEETIEIDDTVEEKKALIKKPAHVSGTTPRSRRRKRKPLIGAPVLVLLLICLLVVGAYIASIMTGYKIPYLSDVKIPFIEQYLKKPAPETSEAKPVPNQKSVNGRFVTNSTAGTLFVITGRVENPSNIAYSHIEILGALITKGKEEAKTKNAFCGNIITEEMLKTGNISDINKFLGVKTGSHNSNVNIKPGASIPFMVVFSDLPEKLQNFTVKVTKFDKTKNN